VGSMDVAGPPGVEATVARRSACLVRRPGRVVATFWPTCGLLFSGTNERGLLMKDTMDGALFWWMGALATGIVVAAAALMS